MNQEQRTIEINFLKIIFDVIFNDISIRKIKGFGKKLPNVVTRFAPEPSGYLHMGHVKAIVMNIMFACQYGGTMLLRFDDTSIIDGGVNFVNKILHDLKSLGIKFPKNNTSYTSNYFDRLLEKADTLVNNGLAYVDTDELNKLKEIRKACGTPSCRNNTIELNKKLWKEMKNGTLKECCLRIKMGNADKNPTLRDPIIYKYSGKMHHKTGIIHKVLPSYDFACPLVDSWEGVTHAFRSNEYSDRGPQYKWMLKICNLVHKPTVATFGRVNFVGSIMSKRQIKKLIENGNVDGWDDPRIPTIAGMLRHGLTKHAMLKFMSGIASSKNDITSGWDKIWAFNRKEIDKTSARYMAIKSDHVVLKLNTPIQEITVPKHPRDKSLGNKTLQSTDKIIIDSDVCDEMKNHDESTFRYVGNIKWDAGIWTLIPNGDCRKTKLKIPWVSAIDHVLVVMHEYDIVSAHGLYKKPVITHGFGESAMKDVKVGDKIQIEGGSYCICDKIVDGVVHLFKIPDFRKKK